MQKMVPFVNRALNESPGSKLGNLAVASYWKRLPLTSSKVVLDEEVWKTIKTCLLHPKCNDTCPALSLLEVVSLRLDARFLLNSTTSTMVWL